MIPVSTLLGADYVFTTGVKSDQWSTLKPRIWRTHADNHGKVLSANPADTRFPRSSFFVR
jgi:hypothetical protein